MIHRVRIWLPYALLAILGSALPALLILSLALAFQQPTPAGLRLLSFIPAAANALLNCHLSLLRPLLYKRCHPDMQGYRFVSGLPSIGTIATAIAAGLTLGSPLAAALGLALCLLDTGGLTWLAITVFHNRAFHPRANS